MIALAVSMAVNASSVADDDDATTVGFSDVYDYAGTSDIVAELKLIPEHYAFQQITGWAD